ncbi:MAG TPA: hypothetical protein VFC23_00310 [Thermoanaerobaculia bacterium]|nr:hypothetical protein [Thermoanaerobaculia bacterium]
MNFRFYIDLPASQEAEMKLNQFPTGWDEQRVQEVVEYYESQTDEDATAEHGAALSSPSGTLMEVPTELVPVFRELIARHQQERGARK